MQSYYLYLIYLSKSSGSVIDRIHHYLILAFVLHHIALIKSEGPVIVNYVTVVLDLTQVTAGVDVAELRSWRRTPSMLVSHGWIDVWTL